MNGRGWFPSLLLLGCFLSTQVVRAEVVETEVLVYGGTPAGIAASLAAAKGGHSVQLVEPYSYVGGMATNGLTHPDFHSFEALTGTFLELNRRVLRYYAETYGEDSPQVLDSFRGTHAEPKVNRRILEAMLAEHPEITIRTRTRLLNTEVETEGETSRIIAARFEQAEGDPITIQARVFIDATYEGDLMAASGVPYRVGREGRDTYGESLAPEEPDEQVQGYNFRLTMTQVPENRVGPLKPPGYQREDYEELVPLLEDGTVKAVFLGGAGGIYKKQTPGLPNGEEDINDISRWTVRLSLPDINDAWPDGDLATRQRIFDEHLRHNVGTLYFLQTDPSVPKAFQEEALRWGFCRNEYPENGHLPEQLYVREARRMIGRYIFNEQDTDHAPGDSRGIFQAESIAAGDYGLNCHGTGHEGPRFGGQHTGEFYKATPPYQIPYGVLLPEHCANLLVPVAVSASHVGFCALRLEPIWTSLGQAAGQAASLAVERDCPVQDVPIPDLQHRLHADGSATIYVSDVSPDSPDFAVVQWWGSLGGLHGLAPTPARPGQRGPRIMGQYYEAFPGHAAELDRELDTDLRDRWLALAEQNGLTTANLRESQTRGEFLRKAYEEAREGSRQPQGSR